jgi:hypothetical protein
MKLAAANLRPGFAIARNVAGLTVRHSVPVRGAKAPWMEIGGNLRQNAEYPPVFDDA